MKPKDPRDEYTPGTPVWAGLVGAGLALEVFGLIYDWRHPGNRRKWTLSSNVTTWAGFDSVTHEPLDVPYGRLRRSALVMFLAWVTVHWTRKGGTF